MYIEPIQAIRSLDDLNTNKVDKKDNELYFKSVFADALNNYIEAENQVDEDIYKLSTGETDDLHTLMINTQKAELSLDLVLQLRNKAIDAYNEIMRIGV